MHGTTDWTTAGKITGQRDLPLCAEGEQQIHTITAALQHICIADVVSSPLMRALQSAEILGRPFSLEVARDPRLTDLRVGRWEGMSYSDVEETDEFRQFIANPENTPMPGGETLSDVTARATAAVEQVVQDNPSGDPLAIVTHPGVVRILLAHYLGLPLRNHQRIYVSHGSASVVAFSHDRELPRVLAINWTTSLPAF